MNGDDDDSGKGSSIPVVPPICTPWTERQLVLFKQKLAHEHHAEGMIISHCYLLFGILASLFLS